MQELLHVGLGLRGHHPLGGGLGIEGLPSQLGRTRNNSFSDLVFSRSQYVKAGSSYTLVFTFVPLTSGLVLPTQAENSSHSPHRLVK